MKIMFIGATGLIAKPGIDELQEIVLLNLQLSFFRISNK